MLIQFFPNGKGGGAGPVTYLTDREVLAYDENRDLIRDKHGQPQTITRDPLPEVLRGDPQRMIDLIDACPHKWSYRAGVISFERDDAPTEDQQQAVIDAFEELAFAGLDGERHDMLWVRHTHEDGVELHFCTPRMDLVTGRSLNIAPPGYARAYDALRDVLNKQHGWADPLDPARAQEVQRPVEATERAQSREAVQDWIMDQISGGLIHDRTGLIAACEAAGFNVPRAGNAYITLEDPETGARFRMKGEIFHEDWTVEQSAERAAGREHVAPARGSCRLAAIPDAELAARLADHIARRARYNESRYHSIPGGEPQHDLGQLPRDREQHQLDQALQLDGADPGGADRGDGLDPDHGAGLGAELRTHTDQQPAVELGADGSAGCGRPASVDRPDQGRDRQLRAVRDLAALFAPEGVGDDNRPDSAGTRIAELRGRAHASLRAIGSGAKRLGAALDRADRTAAALAGRLHHALADLAGRVVEGVAGVAERIRELRRTGSQLATEQTGIERRHAAQDRAVRRAHDLGDDYGH